MNEERIEMELNQEQVQAIIDSYEKDIVFIKKLQQENKELKKQLEEFRLDIINGEPYIKLKTVINQQKEFIEYLENMLDNENDIFSVVRVKDVLSKYQEIIGGNDDNK